MKAKTQDDTLFSMIAVKKLKHVVLTVLLMVILGDVIFLPASSDFRLFGLLAVYILCIVFYKLESKFTFFVALGILITMYIEFVFTSTSVQTEKAAVWLFFFLLVGIIQQWISLRHASE